MAGYLIATIDVHDTALFDQYRQLVTPIIAQYGGRYIVRGGALEQREGAMPPRLVIVAFPSLEAARRFYDSPEYAPVLKLRLDSATSSLVLAEGYDG